MAIRVALNHRTRYKYTSDVWLSPHVVRLHPAPHCRTPVTSYSLKTTPKDPFVNWQQDPYSNRLARLVFPEKTRELSVEVDLDRQFSGLLGEDQAGEPVAVGVLLPIDEGVLRGRLQRVAGDGRA